MSKRGVFPGFATVCLLGAACGGDSGTGPTTSHHVAGNWLYRAWSMATGTGVVCTTPGPYMTLTQNNVVFAGTFVHDTIICTSPSGPLGGTFASGDVLNAGISGDSIRFDLRNSLWRNFGTFVTEDSVAGVVNADVLVEGSQRVLAGYWAAVRQP